MGNKPTRKTKETQPVSPTTEAQQLSQKVEPRNAKRHSAAHTSRSVRSNVIENAAKTVGQISAQQQIRETRLAQGGQGIYVTSTFQSYTSGNATTDPKIYEETVWTNGLQGERQTWDGKQYKVTSLDQGDIGTLIQQTSAISGTSSPRPTLDSFLLIESPPV